MQARERDQLIQRVEEFLTESKKPRRRMLRFGLAVLLLLGSYQQIADMKMQPTLYSSTFSSTFSTLARSALVNGVISR